MPGSADALRRLDAAGVQILYITNNSTRSPEQAAEKITQATGVPVTPDQVVSSSLATVGMLGPDDDPVLVVGEDGVSDAVRRAGLTTTDDPDDARAVVVGLARSFDYDLLARATTAIRGGARFIATNNDPTFPTETGLAPGAGAIVAALVASSGSNPEIAGKPHPPMRAAIRSLGVTDAWVIGDRVDTDVALALEEEGWKSILVLTGVTPADDPGAGAADFVVDDLAAAADLVLSGSDPS